MIGNIAKEAKWVSLQLLQSFATYLCNNCANYKHRTMLLDIINFSYHHLPIVIPINSVSDIYHFSHISYLIITKILFEDHRRMICKNLNRSENEPQKAFFFLFCVLSSCPSDCFLVLRWLNLTLKPLRWQILVEIPHCFDVFNFPICKWMKEFVLCISKTE